MRVIIIDEQGFDSAMLGLSLSYGSDVSRMPARAAKLANMDGGHNKFLESIVVWLDITAPRYWWQQFDTYRVGVTKQSESTMHTLMRGKLTHADYAEGTPLSSIEIVNAAIEAGDLEAAKAALPEGFLQRRVVCTNYKALRHIIAQRKDHKLYEWQTFCLRLAAGLRHPEYLNI